MPDDQPKLFISYAHADGITKVQEFWSTLEPYLNVPGKVWSKWDDREIKVGEDWDRTIMQALQQHCNCCLLLISDLFANSTYINNKEWPATLERFEKKGILFFPVVFSIFENGIGFLPEELRRFQLYWPTVQELYSVPPVSVSNPEAVRQCYIQACNLEETKRTFLSRLAKQMNERFHEYQQNQIQHPCQILPQNNQSVSGNFVTNNSDDIAFAKAIFGPFSYQKRYLDSISKDHYFPRTTDSLIFERLNKQGWLLIEGHPLAGKTRAAYEAIKRLMANGNSVALWSFRPPEPRQQLQLPIFPPADYRIVWMDDIDARLRDLLRHGFTQEHINRFLERMADEGLILLATARTGPAYYDFRHRFGLRDHLWDKLISVLISRLSGDEEQLFSNWYQNSFCESIPDTFDHHTGSLFLDLEAMRDRWENMAEIAGNHGFKINIDYAKELMRALHVFYVMEAYQPGGLFNAKDVLFYLKRKKEHGQQNTALATALARAYERSLSAENAWEQVVEFLSQDKYHLGFLQRDGAFWVTETAYLDYIVAPSGEKNIAHLAMDLFSEDERRKLGLTVSRYNFGELFSVKRPENERELERLIRKLKPLGLERDIVVWNQLLNLCSTCNLARHGLQAMKKIGMRPDVVSYSILLAKAEGLNSGYSILDEMRGDGIVPNVITYSTLLAKAVNLDDGRTILAEMLKTDIAPNVVTYNTLLSKAGDLNTGRVILEEMRKHGIQPNVVTYSTLLDKAIDLDNGREILGEMREDSIKPDIVTYNTLLTKADNLEDGRTIVDEMRKNGIKPNVVIYSTLLTKAANFEEGRAVLEGMRNDGITPNVIAYNTLLARANSLNDGRAVFDEMSAVGVAPNVIIYSALLDKVSNETHGRVVLDEMCKAGVAPNVVTYNTLLARAANLDDGRVVLAEMRKVGISPNVVTYSTLLTKAKSLNDGRILFDEMSKDKVRPDVVIYSTLLGKANNLRVARTILEDMRKDGIPPNVVAYSVLLGKVASMGDGRVILNEMRKDDVKPDVVTYSTLLAKAADLEDGRSIVDEMRKDDITPNLVTYNTLLAKATTLDDGYVIIDDMVHDRVKPDVVTYSTLLSKAANLEDGRAILAEMGKLKIKPNSYTYTAYLKLVVNVTEIEEALAMMKAGNVPFNRYHLNTIKPVMQRSKDVASQNLWSHLKDLVAQSRIMQR